MFELPIHISVLFGLSIILIGVYLALRTHEKASRISKDDDFISLWEQRVQKELHRAGDPVTLDQYKLIMIIAPVVLGAASFIGTKRMGSSAVFVIVGFFVPRILVMFLKMRSEKDFDEKYSRALEQLSASLRAGLSIDQAIDDVTKCKFIHPTMRRRFAQIGTDIQMGIPIAEAFQRFADNTNSEDAQDVALAIDVQDTVGGKESEVIGNIAAGIRSRMMMKREMSSMFASTTSMVYMMDFVPVVIVFCTLTNPTYVNAFFTSPLGFICFGFCLGFPIIGVVINHRIVGRVKEGKG